MDFFNYVYTSGSPMQCLHNNQRTEPDSLDPKCLITYCRDCGAILSRLWVHDNGNKNYEDRIS
jgi:hypothetical protein